MSTRGNRASVRSTHSIATEHAINPTISKSSRTLPQSVARDANVTKPIRRSGSESESPHKLRLATYQTDRHKYIVPDKEPKLLPRNSDPAWQNTFQKAYSKFAANKVSRLPDIMANYKGNEVQWWKTFCSAHELSPADQAWCLHMPDNRASAHGTHTTATEHDGAKRRKIETRSTATEHAARSNASSSAQRTHTKGGQVAMPRLQNGSMVLVTKITSDVGRHSKSSDNGAACWKEGATCWSGR